MTTTPNPVPELTLPNKPTTSSLPPQAGASLSRTQPRQTPAARRATLDDDTLFQRVDTLHTTTGLQTKALRWQYFQPLATNRKCTFGRRITMVWQPPSDKGPLGVRNFSLRVTMPPLVPNIRPTATQTRLWHPYVLWHFFERIEFYVGENTAPVATVYPDTNAWLLGTVQDAFTKHQARQLAYHHRQFDSKVVQRDVGTDYWTFELPLVLPMTNGHDTMWFVRGLGDQALRMVITLHDVLDCVLIEDNRIQESKLNPHQLAKRLHLPLNMEMTWLASTGYASRRYAASLGYLPTRTQFSTPWPSIQRVGMLHADTWWTTFHDMSYWQVSLHDTGLISALLFVLDYDSADQCDADSLPFEAIEVLTGVDRLTKINYSDATTLADALTFDIEGVNTSNQVALIPFCDDPLLLKHTISEVTFVDLASAPITVRLLQPSKLATHTMNHLKIYAVRLGTLNWSSTTNQLDTYQT